MSAHGPICEGEYLDASRNRARRSRPEDRLSLLLEMTEVEEDGKVVISVTQIQPLNSCESRRADGYSVNRHAAASGNLLARLISGNVTTGHTSV